MTCCQLFCPRCPSSQTAHPWLPSHVHVKTLLPCCAPPPTHTRTRTHHLLLLAVLLQTRTVCLYTVTPPNPLLIPLFSPSRFSERGGGIIQQQHPLPFSCSSPDTLTHMHEYMHTFSRCSVCQMYAILMTPPPPPHCLNLLFLLRSERADTLSSNVYSLPADYC